MDSRPSVGGDTRIQPNMRTTVLGIKMAAHEAAPMATCFGPSASGASGMPTKCRRSQDRRLYIFCAALSACGTQRIVVISLDTDVASRHFTSISPITSWNHHYSNERNKVARAHHYLLLFTTINIYPPGCLASYSSRHFASRIWDHLYYISPLVNGEVCASYISQRSTL